MGYTYDDMVLFARMVYAVEPNRLGGAIEKLLDVYDPDLREIINKRFQDKISKQAMQPKIVCLCGSTKFWKEFQKQNLRLTLERVILLSIGAASGSDDEHFGNLFRQDYDKVKDMLDELHLRKIDLCDEIFVINVGGYIGESTRKEIEYAKSIDKPIKYLE